MTSLLLVAAMGWQGTPRGVRQPDPKCGLYCLYVALGSLGLDTGGFEKFEGSLGEITSEGYSMQQLAMAAGAKGAETLGVETSLENLQARTQKFVCIAFVKPKHFLVIKDIHASSVAIVDPPTTYELPKDTFNTLWNGQALLISRTVLLDETAVGKKSGFLKILLVVVGCLGIVLAALKYRNSFRFSAMLLAVFCLGCGNAGDQKHEKIVLNGLQPSPPSHDLGEIMKKLHSTDLQVRTTLTNMGSRAVTIKAIRASCGCTKLNVSSNIVDPGRSVILDATIDPGNVEEARLVVFSVESDDSVNPMLEVPTTWRNVNPMTILPLPEIAAGPNEKTILRNRYHILIDKNVYSKAAALSAELAQSGIDTKLIPLNQRFDDQKIQLGILEVAIQNTFEPGPDHGNLKLRYGEAERSIAKLEHQITWNVKLKAHDGLRGGGPSGAPGRYNRPDSPGYSPA